jgi:hypothetical protein
MTASTCSPPKDCQIDCSWAQARSAQLFACGEGTGIVPASSSRQNRLCMRRGRSRDSRLAASPTVRPSGSSIA